MVDELQRRGSGTALGTVHHDEIRANAGFRHRLAERRYFALMTHPQLNGHRLATGELTQTGDKRHGLDGDAPRLGDLHTRLGSGQSPSLAPRSNASTALAPRAPNLMTPIAHGTILSSNPPFRVTPVASVSTGHPDTDPRSKRLPAAHQRAECAPPPARILRP